MSRWQVYQDKFYALPRKRRGFWLGVGLIAVTALVGGQVVQPQWDAWRSSLQQETRLQQELTQLQQTAGQTQRALAGDPNAALTAQQQQANERLAELRQQLREKTAYVNAKDNRALLQAVLAEADNLVVVGAEALPPEPLLMNTDSNANTSIYQHRLRLRIKGSYFEIRDYFAALEELPWSFYWHRLQYSVASYPQGEVEVEIYTLSMEQDYVGV